MKTIGVLALQGGFAKHIEKIKALGEMAFEVRTSEQLQACDGLIIPGGESTTLNRLLSLPIENRIIDESADEPADKSANFRDAIKIFAQKKPIFGTCAGLILMAKKVANQAHQTNQTYQTPQQYQAHPDHSNGLGLLDITVERNAYGRQADSFRTSIYTLSHISSLEVSAIFIRAPKITHWGSSVQVLASLEDSPILVQQHKYLGCAFHPELTEDVYVHQHFLNMIHSTS